jgi:hypothetical protein
MLDGKKRFAAEIQINPRPLFSMCLLEDANAVQVALMQVLQLLGSGQMDHKTAGLMLYGLQTASTNLRNAEFEVDEATDVVIDRDDVYRTSIGGPQWLEEDFEDDADEEDESDDEADGEEAAAAPETASEVQAEAAPEAAPEVTAAVQRAGVIEARKKVQGLVREWILETVGVKQAAEPG